MRRLLTVTAAIILTSCVRGPNPADPYEPFNREVHKFNRAFDATMLRPPAKLYYTVVPGFVRAGVNNFYNNINMIPTIANDLLQADLVYAWKDAWRLLINTTFGIGGILDVASACNLPPHSNDLGLTFAKWGDKNSPYIVLPFLGPTTVRDGFGAIFNFPLFTPYPWINDKAVLYSLLGLRYIDLRAQMFEVEPIAAEALDNYSFIRDAYLQHRNYIICGGTGDSTEALYIDE